jgi:integrase/recombinase XerC
VCERLFDAVPARVTHELNLIRHKGDYEGRPDANRPLTRAEQDKFFAVVERRAHDAARLHRKGAAAAHRDAIMFLVMLGWGTRRRCTGWWRKPRSG